MPSHLERQEMPSWGCDALLKMAAKAPGKIINPFLVLIQNGFRASGYSDRTKKNGSFLINVCLLRKYWYQVCITPFKKFLRGHLLQSGRASPTYLEGIAYKPGGHLLQTERASLVGLGECRGHLLRAWRLFIFYAKRASLDAGGHHLSVKENQWCCSYALGISVLYWLLFFFSAYCLNFMKKKG